MKKYSIFRIDDLLIAEHDASAIMQLKVQDFDYLGDVSAKSADEAIAPLKALMATRSQSSKNTNTPPLSQTKALKYGALAFGLIVLVCFSGYSSGYSKGLDIYSPTKCAQSLSKMADNPFRGMVVVMAEKMADAAIKANKNIPSIPFYAEGFKDGAVARVIECTL